MFVKHDKREGKTRVTPSTFILIILSLFFENVHLPLFYIQTPDFKQGSFSVTLKARTH
jgi:hypothetical protein